MSVWMEMRCEGRRDEGSYDDCFSHGNVGPMGDAEDTQVSVHRTLSAMRSQALREGWVLGAAGWICPMCAKRKGLK